MAQYIHGLLARHARTALAPALTLMLAACGGSPSWVQDLNPLASREPAPRAISAEDFVDPQGRCSGGDEAALTGAAVGLGMTECEVARRAGLADRIDVSANDRGERLVVMSYLAGPRPGVYRFQSGRLVTIERAAEAATPAAQGKKAKNRKTN